MPIIMTPQSQRAAKRVLVPAPPTERPHRWHKSPPGVNAMGFYYSNSGDAYQYKGQVWQRPEGWYACVRWHQLVGTFGSMQAAQAYVEEEVARLIAQDYTWYPGEEALAR